MSTRARAAVALALVLSAVLLGAPDARADRGRPIPSQAEVDRARAAVTAKAGDVAALQAALAVANARLEAAAQQAEIAAEAYNGARWRLERARQEARRAHRQATAAADRVDQQRAGIAALVTQTYQDGSALGTVSAILGGDGPTGVMNRLGVVQSAGESMQARYDEYTASAALAQVSAQRAEQAERVQADLAAKAAVLRDRAAAAAGRAQSEAARIAVERRRLVAELAAAQHVSVALASRRQRALEEIAQEKAAAAAAAKAKAQAQAAKDAADKAKQDAGGAGGTTDGLGGDGSPGVPEGGWEDPGLSAPRGTNAGASQAIAFARDQLGEPYQWGAAGPDSWDCSGLTMMAWRRGGVSLPHYSAAQYDQTKHIGVGQLRPGDLVFWGSSPNTIHHVAIYLGNGQIIHAPRTGKPVQVNSMYYWVPPDYFGRP